MWWSKFFIGLVVLISLSCQPEKNESVEDINTSKVPVIFDTDFGPDYDDVGALALLHSYADSGRAEILAVMASSLDERVIPSIDVVNTYFGRPDIPIGRPSSPGVNLGAWQGWADTLIANYSYDTTNQVNDAVKLYRKILAESDDKITIISVGFLTNLGNLIMSQPDEFSDLGGQDLVNEKVEQWVCMGGVFPSGREFNIEKDSMKSKIAIDAWPTPIVFTGGEIGSKVKTGLRLVNNDDLKNSPVKDVYKIGMSRSEDDRLGRMSWDQTAVLIAIEGSGPWFEAKSGKFISSKDGSNSWLNDENNGVHKHVLFQQTPEEVANYIEIKMMHKPTTPN